MSLYLKSEYSIASWIIALASTTMLNSTGSTFAGVVLDSIDYQIYRDFAENKGVFIVGATNINIYDKNGNYRGSLNQAPMPDFKTIDALGGYSTLVHPGYSIGVAHNIKPSPVNYFGDGEVSPDTDKLYTGIIPPDKNAYLYELVKATNHPDYWTDISNPHKYLNSMDLANYRYDKLVTEVAPINIVPVGTSSWQSSRYTAYYRAGKGTQYMYKSKNIPPELVFNAYNYATGGTVAPVGRALANQWVNVLFYNDQTIFDSSYGPLPNYGAGGDSGSPLFVWDKELKQWLVAGVYSAWSNPTEGRFTREVQHSLIKA